VKETRGKVSRTARTKIGPFLKKTPSGKSTGWRGKIVPKKTKKKKIGVPRGGGEEEGNLIELWMKGSRETEMPGQESGKK